LLAGVLGLLFSVVAAIKSDSLMLFLLGIGWLVGMLIIDYASRRFDQTSDRLVASTKSYLSSTVYVDAIALILLVASVGLFCFGIYGAIKAESISFLAKIGGLSVWMFYVSLITMNAASMLNVEFKNGLKAEEDSVLDKQEA
jgi:ABC-type multidrug transport system fused ATPase/permease subunit